MINKTLKFPVILSLVFSFVCCSNATSDRNDSDIIYIGNRIPPGYRLFYYEKDEVPSGRQQKYYLKKSYTYPTKDIIILDSIEAIRFSPSGKNVLSYINIDSARIHLVSLYLDSLYHDTISSYYFNDSLNILADAGGLDYINKDSILLVIQSTSDWNRDISIIKLLPQNDWKEVLRLSSLSNLCISLDYNQILFVEDNDPNLGFKSLGAVFIYDLTMDSLFALPNSGDNNIYAKRKDINSPIYLLKKINGISNIWKYTSTGTEQLTSATHPYSIDSFELFEAHIEYTKYNSETGSDYRGFTIDQL